MKKGTKNKGENKSQMIRDYAAANPGLTQAQITKALLEQGANVYPGLVGQALRSVKGKIKPKAKRRGRPPKAASKSTTKKTSSAPVATATDYVDLFKSASDFVKQAGGIDQAVEALKVYQKLSSILNS